MTDNIACFVSSKVFETKYSMMLHRRSEHRNTVKFCSQFQIGNCRFKDEACWFKHEQENEDIDEEAPEEEEEEVKPKQKQGFQKVSEDLEPPIQNQPERKALS